MLKSLELFGFKSFADRTIFEFSEGITCVVGPNGSGKSNVVDGIKWVLGDQSPKSLRGKDMTDVIFNGSKGRKANAYAEATLTFKNKDRFLDIDAEEVHIGRRLWKNGDSEYLLNRNPVRLKDIRDLFMGTGAATSAYSIIEQGRVDQILQANAATRRVVFEEAAGISRYKSRKVDAERKLERVGQNILRLTDIVDEVEAQLNSTRSQASKAAKYREASTELRKLWMGMAADDWRHLTAQLSTLQGQIGQYQKRIDELNIAYQEYEEKLGAIDSEVAEFDDQLRSVEKQLASHREGIAGNQTAIEHQLERKSEFESEILRLRKQRILMAKRTTEIQRDLEAVTKEKESSEAGFELQREKLQEAQERITTVTAELDAISEEIQQKRQQVHDLNKQSLALDNRVFSMQTQQETVSNSMAKANEKRLQLEARVEEADAVVAECTERFRTAGDKVAEFAQSLSAVDEKQQDLLSQQDQRTQQLSELRERRSAYQARKSVLEDLERRQEGLSIGVKDILNRAQTSNYPPWNTILGSVADLLDVELEQAALLEVALGSRSQLLVISEFEPLYQFLKEGKYSISGRVGFITHPTAQVEQPEAVSGFTLSGDAAVPETFSAPTAESNSTEGYLDLSGERGVIYRADQLVKETPENRRLAELLLTDTWIVDSLETAVRLSREEGKQCRFVTLQGELVEENLSIFVGAIGGESAIFTRRSELRKLKNDLIRIDRTLNDNEVALEKLDDLLSTVDEERVACQEQMQQASEALATEKASKVSAEQKREQLSEELSTVLSDLHDLEAHSRKLTEEAEAVLVEKQQVEAELERLNQLIQEDDKQLLDKQCEVQELKEQQNARKLELATHEERLAGLEQRFSRLKTETEQRQQQQEESNRRYESSLEKNSQINLHILNTRAVLDEQLLIQETFLEQARSLTSLRDEKRQYKKQLSSEEAALRKERRELSDKKHEEEFKTRDIEHEIKTLAERIEEEYQLTLEEIVSSGESILKQHLEELAEAEQELSAATDGVEETDLETEAIDEQTELEEVALEAEPEEPVEIELVNEEDATSEPGFNVELYLEIRPEIEAQVNRLRRKIKMMGSINSDSLKDLDELECRFEYMKSQLDDLNEAKSSLEEIIRRINHESKRLFFDTFEVIRGHFQEIFRKLFGGGEADIILEDPDDVLECGIEIVARPPGKELRGLTLLSGGEKTLTAVALLMSIFRSRPSPFCILDEVDAALDEANVERYAGLIDDFKETTQFIMITHNKRSMTVGNVLYGVTMEQSGVSKRMSVRFDDISEDGHFKQSGSGEDGASEAA
ncbi:Chromosome partition protein Smc [Gimesia panareensis]|uniref:Chromosome partition protein Smc n=1 Tax=Gimesia panareensis TaxID=2527978 RepID=A0A517Q1T5_9PLAN|nr:AAA family ATPase [Gimesia panareensis]QDT25590.1 Chromosome partition protein Smc [Gimesia panareensis]